MFRKLINKLNDMRPKQLLMLAAIAAVLMFLTVYVGMSLLTKKEIVIQPEPEKPAVQTEQVVVAKVNIPPRTRIQESMLQMKEMPVDMVPEGAIKNFADVNDVQVKVSIFAGDILTIQKVFNEKGDEGFVGSIPPDCRAISISVNDLTSVAGFAKPGDRVDLLLVEKGQYSVTTNLLLQNVPLLSINQSTDSSPSVSDGVSSQAISNPSIATFALPPEDALKLISASKLGEIYMSLRPSNPRQAYVGSMEYTIESINTPPPEPVREAIPAIPSNSAPSAPLPQIPATPPTPKIEIIQGDQVIQGTGTPSTGGAVLPSTPLPVIPSNGANPAVTSPPVPSPPLVKQGLVGN